MSEIILKFEPNINIRHTCHGHGDISYLSYVDSDSAMPVTLSISFIKKQKGFTRNQMTKWPILYTTVALRPNESKMGGNTARDTNTHILTLTFQKP